MLSSNTLHCLEPDYYRSLHISNKTSQIGLENFSEYHVKQELNLSMDELEIHDQFTCKFEDSFLEIANGGACDLVMCKSENLKEFSSIGVNNYPFNSYLINDQDYEDNPINRSCNNLSLNMSNQAVLISDHNSFASRYISRSKVKSERENGSNNALVYTENQLKTSQISNFNISIDFDSNIEITELLKRHDALLENLFESLKDYSSCMTKFQFDSNLYSSTKQKAMQKTSNPNYFNYLLVQHLKSGEFKHSAELINLVDMNIQNEECKSYSIPPLVAIESIEPDYNINLYFDNHSYNYLRQEDIKLLNESSDDFGVKEDIASEAPSSHEEDLCSKINFEYEITSESFIKEETTSVTDFVHKSCVNERETYLVSKQFVKEMTVIRNLIAKFEELNSVLKCFEDLVNPHTSDSETCVKNEDSSLNKTKAQNPLIGDKFINELQYPTNESWRPSFIQMLMRKRKRKYNILNNEEKEKCLNLAANTNLYTAAIKYNVPLKNLKRWMKNGVLRKKGCGRKMISGDIESRLIFSINNYVTKDNRDVIDYSWIRRKVINLMETSNCSYSKSTAFMASNTWIRKLLSKHNIKLKLTKNSSRKLKSI